MCCYFVCYFFPAPHKALSRLGDLMACSGVRQYSEAVALYSQSIEILIKHYRTETHNDVGLMHRNLGCVYKSQVPTT